MDDPALTALVEDLGSPTWPPRERARRRLETLDAAAVPAILRGCRHHDPQIRADCVSLLDHLADERCLDALRDALADPSARVRRHAIHSLGCQRCKPGPLDLDVVGLILPLALADPSIRVRRVAVHQLGLQPSDPRIPPALDRIIAHGGDAGLLRRAAQAHDTHAAGAAAPNR